ncbi:brefeldin A-inhibited guanine nucleotide-exchange protein 3-like [Ylistrum balloti]|uniref:brefeldin A-inhibited guanine nucleotide-exchange protein 3-like n=1 Tax=Ylistrum balloti TaxID=509963 RepID=UPI002905CB10|nr:brefeldin A-inhibited guanine nucleotide-exchange protein 3-like [Ylistrum balloti]
MEDLLTQLMKDASSQKHAGIRKASQTALDLLENPTLITQTPAYVLREKCLEPLQLALESKTKKLATYAVGGIQQILKDEKFQSSMESDKEEHWLPIQILNTVFSTPSLPEDTQVEIMKLLLKMTFSTAWCMNAGVITKVSQVYIDTYIASTHSVRGAVKAALTQLLSCFTEKLQQGHSDQGTKDRNDVLADFMAKDTPSCESLFKDVVAILKFFTAKLEQAPSSNQTRQSIPLLLEGVYTVISNSPVSITEYKPFQEVLWKYLCPCLISLLGTPKSERSAIIPKSLEDVGRGSGCSLTAPNLQVSTAKTIYSIAVRLVDLMGPVTSLRPVLESLFHRMLLYPPPQHRLDALKAVKELLKTPEGLYKLACPMLDLESQDGDMRTGTKNPNSDIALLKLIVDALQESCHCNDSAVCITSVTCVDVLLGALEQVCKGVGMTDKVCKSISKYHATLEREFSRSSSLTMSEDDVQEYRSSVSEPLEEAGNSEDSDSDMEDRNTPTEGSTEVFVTNHNTTNLIPLHKRNTHANRKESQSVIKDELQRRYKTLGSEYEMVERQNARLFISELSRTLPHIVKMYTAFEVDEALQNFSSNFCTALYDQQYKSSEENSSSCQMAILNADGVYMATITALLLNLKLDVSGAYSTSEDYDVSILQKQYVDEVLGTGLLLFLSPAWLSEVYRQVTTTNILQAAGCHSDGDSPLLQILKDVDGLGSNSRGGQLLNGMNSSDEVLDSDLDPPDNQLYADMGKKFSKRVLSRCWDGVLDVLSVLLNGKSSCGITSSLGLMLGTEGAKEESIRAREAICMSLDGLQKAARLCCALGLQQRCGRVFSQLASTSCVLIDTQKSPSVDPKSSVKPVMSSKIKPVRLHASHILSMDVVMTNGLEMGSHSADCWKHVFRCSAFISKLEHTYFSSGNNQSSLPKVQQEHSVGPEIPDECDMPIYTIPVAAPVPVAPRINIPDLIRQSSKESGWDRSLTGGGVLNAAQASQALCCLSQEVDRLFEDAAQKLNLCAIVNFLSELCEASQHQLNMMVKLLDDEDSLSDSHQLPTNALHLYRLQEVLMKIVHSDRPLIHLMRTWSTVSTHLVEAAGHHDRSVSKMAVTCVHDFILAMLGDRPELAHFHVNELLCKTFENMLCLELCDGDVQDQIVCSICELVEACTADIKSGWRPLFGALRAVKIEYTTNEEINEARQRHVAAVLDVFEVYLGTDNILVFANATVDCILCLLKYIRGPGEFENDSDDDSDSGSDCGMLSTDNENLCIPALRYLKRCCEILQTMWKMPACPVFNGAFRIHTDSSQQIVDPILPHMDMEEFTKHFNTPIHTSDFNGDTRLAVIEDPTGTSQLSSQRSLEDEERTDTGSITSNDSGITVVPGEKTVNSGSNQDTKTVTKEKTKPLSLPSDVEDTLESMDNQSGILHVWFLVVDGLAGSVASCPKIYQSDTLEMLFSILKSAANIPGPTFALYCVNRLLLPMLQSWLRAGVRKYGYWDTGATNFKQCCGLCTDLIVDFTQQFAGCKDKTGNLVEVMLKQLLDIMIECIAQPVEVISRLGCSCIRHMLLSAGESFTENMWQISSTAMQRALDVTTFHLRQLMILFEVNSENFYGDRGQVKVAMRRDSSSTECKRLQHLAHQVFLLDSQVSGDTALTSEVDEDKSFVFLLYPPGQENSLNPDDIIARIPFRGVVVGLLSHQLLLQTVGSVLLNPAHHPQASPSERPDHKQHFLSLGMVPMMSTRNILTLLKCLWCSNKLAGEFDSRPGLKFLIQKVARTEVAVNLYKQAGASMIFYMNTLLQICACFNDLSRPETRTCLTGSDADKLDIGQALSLHQSDKSEMRSNKVMFIQLLWCVCNDLCQMYVDMLSDEYIEKADQMAERELFFLIAQPDSITDIVHSKDRHKSGSDTEAVIQLQGVMATEAVALQEETCESPQHEMKGTVGKSKRELREEHDSRVYTLATDTLIKTLMTEYKKRKQHHAMPAFVKLTKQKKSNTPQQKKEVVDDVIEKQQKTSLMKDSEARAQSLTELLCTILGLFQQLSDQKFEALLPAIYNCANQLVCHAQDPRLKEALGQWTHRIGAILQLMPSSP